MKKIMVNVQVPDEALDPIRGKLEVVMPTDKPAFSREEVLERIGDCAAMLCLGLKVDKEVLDLANQLEVVGVVGVGYDNVDWKYATEKNVFVVNCPREVLHPTAELTIAIMLDVMRCTVSYDRELRNTLKATTPAFVHRATLAYGKTLGIIGFGRIGRGVAEKARGLGMKIIYSDTIRADEETEKALDAQYLSMEDLIRASDVISLHCPYMPETHHLFAEEQFEMMKESAYLVNASRGPVVKETALMDALREKRIRGAALDVFEHEPDVSEEMAKLDNIVIVPHIGAQCYEVRIALCHESLNGIIGCLEGEKPYNVVNPTVFDKR